MNQVQRDKLTRLAIVVIHGDRTQADDAMDQWQDAGGFVGGEEDGDDWLCADGSATEDLGEAVASWAYCAQQSA